MRMPVSTLFAAAASLAASIAPSAAMPTPDAVALRAALAAATGIAPVACIRPGWHGWGIYGRCYYRPVYVAPVYVAPPPPPPRGRVVPMCWIAGRWRPC
jgi:hypothetical protein